MLLEDPRTKRDSKVSNVPFPQERLQRLGRMVESRCAPCTTLSREASYRIAHAALVAAYTSCRSTTPRSIPRGMSAATLRKTFFILSFFALSSRAVPTGVLSPRHLSAPGLKLCPTIGCIQMRGCERFGSRKDLTKL